MHESTGPLRIARRDRPRPGGPEARAERPIGAAWTAAGFNALLAAFILTACGQSGESNEEPDKSPTIVEPAPKPTEPVSMDEGCVTEACHASFMTAPVIHAPIADGDCAACHEEDTGEHVFPLVPEATRNQRCLNCHETGREGSNQHAAINDPGCTACHDAHRSSTPGLISAESVEAQCRSCHPKLLKRYNHDPYDQDECISCHDPHETGTETLLLGGSGSEHCFMCHEETREGVEASAFDHEGVARDCKVCHSGHASNYLHLIRRRTADICFTCHAEMETQITQAPVPHDDIFGGGECFRCHAPHGSGRSFLLRKVQAELCLECHEESVEATDGSMIQAMGPILHNRRYQHGPVRFDECSACHTIHGGTRPRLLKAEYTTDFYAEFKVEHFALCFTCHNAELVTVAETENLTSFRDGDRNLHYVHVQHEGRGRTCRSCHAVHASDQPKHIAREVPFEGSDWLMPIRYESTATGGRCAPGCHEPMSYSRATAPQRDGESESEGEREREREDETDDERNRNAPESRPAPGTEPGGGS